MSLLDAIKAALGMGGDARSQIEMMSCEDVGRVLIDYMDGELDAEARARIEAHLDPGRCECRRALLLEIAFNEKVRGCLDARSTPGSLKQRVLESLTDQSEPPPSR